MHVALPPARTSFQSATLPKLAGLAEVAPTEVGLSDTLTLGFTACWSRLRKRRTCSRPAFRSAPAPGSQRFGFALARLAGNDAATAKMAGGAATVGVGMKQCFRDRTQHTLSVWSFVPHSHLNSARPDYSPRAGPFRPELRSDNVALCDDPAAALSRGVRPGPRIRPGTTARPAPAGRHPSRQPRRSCNQAQPWPHENNLDTPPAQA